jgi:hypothetical protein
MLLDFTNPVLDPRITFSRGTGATRVNASGFIEVVGTTTPRFDYDPVTLAPRGLLIEEARTNLLTYSDDWSNAAWVKNLTTVAANATPSPDGTTNADRLTETATSGEHYTSQQIAKAASNITYTHSVYFKNGAGTRNFGISITDGTTGGYGAIFSTSGSVVSASFAIGSVVGWTFVSSAVTPAGNGWYRASLTVTSNLAIRLDGVCYLVSGTTTSYAGDGTSNIFIYGAQLEAGAFATSYIPTVASTVSRSADVATMTGTNFSSWYNQSEGTFVVDSLRGAITTAAYMLTASDNTTAEYTGLLFTTSQRASSIVVDGSVTQVNLVSAANAAPTNTQSKATIAYKLNDSNMAVNGTALTDDTACTMPTVNRLYIGSDVNGGSLYLNGHIRAIAYYNTRLPNTQLQTLTAPSLASPLALDFISPTYTVGY